MLWIISVFLIFFIPEISYAWGPLTHVYLSQQIFNLSHFIPLSILPVIKIYREYFMYGNIIPDTVIGKKYLPDEKNPHSWKTGLNLLQEAKTQEEKAFAYGFLTHLAADAILHHDIKNLNPLQHMIFELKADRIVDRFYWLQIMTINKKVRKISDSFFEQTIVKPIVSLKTSKKLYKSFIFLSAFNMGDLKNHEAFDIFHLKSLTAMLEILNHGEKAYILNLPTHN
ncbi:MAG: zinc dependent phospholipase C family protein [Thermodesulfovibrio sp.]|nr:zinc dependent phospholipase C family protein [Thermodesulfovibrio sp.]